MVFVGDDEEPVVGQRLHNNIITIIFLCSIIGQWFLHNNIMIVINIPIFIIIIIIIRGWAVVLTQHQTLEC